jgi:hypothetical protein
MSSVAATRLLMLQQGYKSGSVTVIKSLIAIALFFDGHPQ